MLKAIINDCQSDETKVLITPRVLQDIATTTENILHFAETQVRDAELATRPINSAVYKLIVNKYLQAQLRACLKVILISCEWEVQSAAAMLLIISPRTRSKDGSVRTAEMLKSVLDVYGQVDAALTACILEKSLDEKLKDLSLISFFYGTMVGGKKKFELTDAEDLIKQIKEQIQNVLGHGWRSDHTAKDENFRELLEEFRTIIAW